METKLMAGAFLRYDNKVLLMKRGLNKTLNPGKWAPIGGHLEPHEMNSPTTACLREIFEETGINSDNIIDFRMKYIIVRNNNSLIYINYLFVGKLNHLTELIDCSEGSLHWVDYDSLPGYDMSFSIVEACKHLVNSINDMSVVLGAVNFDNTKISWNEL